MLQFLSCMETSIESIGGKFDPPLSTVQEEEDGNKVSSADPSKAKRRFPWTKKEVSTLVKTSIICTGQYTFQILLLNDDNMLGEHKGREKNIVYGRLF